MREFYKSPKHLDETQLKEIKGAIPGCSFGYTGVRTEKGFEYSLTFPGDALPTECQQVLKKFRLRK
jgi:hypothetical protein